jgi:hypothetical protein
MQTVPPAILKAADLAKAPLLPVATTATSAPTGGREAGVSTAVASAEEEEEEQEEEGAAVTTTTNETAAATAIAAGRQGTTATTTRTAGIAAAAPDRGPGRGRGHPGALVF